MKKTRYSEEQIIGSLQQAKAGRRVPCQVYYVHAVRTPHCTRLPEVPSLPMYPELMEAQLEEVAAAVRGFGSAAWA